MMVMLMTETANVIIGYILLYKTCQYLLSSVWTNHLPWPYENPRRCRALASIFRKVVWLRPSISSSRRHGIPQARAIAIRRSSSGKSARAISHKSISEISCGDAFRRIGVRYWGYYKAAICLKSPQDNFGTLGRSRALRGNRRNVVMAWRNCCWISCFNFLLNC